jgi:hypothetical protein
MLTQDDLRILKRPFKPQDMEWLEQDRTKKNGEKFTLVLAYVAEEAITDRIEMVDPSWEFTQVSISERGGHVYATAQMTIKGVTRCGVGMEEIKHLAEAEKSAATDALKRAARLFGIGRYILSLPKWAQNKDGYAKWYSQNKDKDADNIDSEQPEPDAPIADKVKASYGTHRITTPTSPFAATQRTEPTIEEHFEDSDFANPEPATVEQFTDVIEKVTVKPKKNGNGIFYSVGNLTIFDLSVFEELGYSALTLEQLSKPGTVVLEDGIRVAYLPADGAGRKYNQALRVFRPVNQAKVVLKDAA